MATQSRWKYLVTVIASLIVVAIAVVYALLQFIWTDANDSTLPFEVSEHGVNPTGNVVPNGPPSVPIPTEPPPIN